MAVTEGQDRATTRVAAIVKAMLLEMLEAGQTGTVTVEIIDLYHLKPVKHVATEGSTVKVERGVAGVIVTT